MDRRVTSGGAAEAKATAVARPCAAVARPSPPEATPEVQTTSVEEKARWKSIAMD